MKSRVVARWSKLALGVAAAMALAGISIPASYAADEATIYMVQGLPGKNLDVAVDGKSVAKNIKTAAVAGPFKVKAGSRKVTFSEEGDTVLDRVFAVKANSSWDVVVHLPASAGADPMVTVFRNDLVKLPKDKASLVVAHTAVVPPADIRVNGKVLFANIANGESLKLTVPVATYEVAIVPTGEKKPVVLGPVALTVQGGAVNRVYAVGDPEKKTMNVAVHVIPTGSKGSGKPSKVDTGTGGQAVGQDTTFKLPSGAAVKLTR
jgi:hypothetical protein